MCNLPSKYIKITLIPDLEESICRISSLSRIFPIFMGKYRFSETNYMYLSRDETIAGIILRMLTSRGFIIQEELWLIDFDPFPMHQFACDYLHLTRCFFPIEWYRCQQPTYPFSRFSILTRSIGISSKVLISTFCNRKVK